MFEHVLEAYHRAGDARPFVRPTYNQFEVEFLPPLGDPEVHVPRELLAYAATCLLVDRVVDHLHDD